MIYTILYMAGLVGLLYWLGGVLMETHTPIQQEMIKIEVKKDSVDYEMWCSPEGYEAIEEYVKFAEGEEKE